MGYGDNYGNPESGEPEVVSEVERRAQEEITAYERERAGVTALLAMVETGDSFVVRRDANGNYDLVLRQWYERTTPSGEPKRTLRAVRGTGRTVWMALGSLVRNMEDERWRHV